MSDRPIFEPWRGVAILLIVLAGWAYLWALTPARSETLAYRLEVEACADKRCVPIPSADVRWQLYECQARAKPLADAMRDRLNAPKLTDIAVSARCVPVEGAPEA